MTQLRSRSLLSALTAPLALFALALLGTPSPAAADPPPWAGRGHHNHQHHYHYAPQPQWHHQHHHSRPYWYQPPISPPIAYNWQWRYFAPPPPPPIVVVRPSTVPLYAPRGTQPFCQPWTGPVMTEYGERLISGTACLLADGTWQLVN